MFMGVADLSMIFLGNWAFSPGVSDNVFRPTVVSASLATLKTKPTSCKVGINSFG